MTMVRGPGASRNWGIRSPAFPSRLRPAAHAGSSCDLRGGAARIESRVLHSWDIYSNVFALPGAALAGVPLRIGSRRGLGGPSPVRRLQRWSFRTAHKIVANSRAAAAQVIGEGLPAARIDIVPNGIDLSLFPERTRRTPIKTITMVACLREGKRIDVLIAAAAQILARHPDVEFQIVGDGPCRDALLAQARSSGVLPHVRFMGHRDDVPAILSPPPTYLSCRPRQKPHRTSSSKPWPQVCPLSLRGSAVSRSWLLTGSRDTLCRPAIQTRWLQRFWTSLIIRNEASRSGALAVRESRASTVERMVMQFETLYLTGSIASVSPAVLNSSGTDQCPA